MSVKKEELKVRIWRTMFDISCNYFEDMKEIEKFLSVSTVLLSVLLALYRFINRRLNCMNAYCAYLLQEPNLTRFCRRVKFFLGFQKKTSDEDVTCGSFHADSSNAQLPGRRTTFG